MAETEILPEWAARYIQDNIAEHMHVINVLPMDEGAARGWLLNTSKGAVVVVKGRLREPRHWFLPLPGERVTFRCHRCRETMELVDPDVPRTVHCSACGKRHYLVVRRGKLVVEADEDDDAEGPGSEAPGVETESAAGEPMTGAAGEPMTGGDASEQTAASQRDPAPPPAPQDQAPPTLATAPQATPRKSTSGPFRYRGFTLHKRRVDLKGGGTQEIYFFAKSRPKSGRPTTMPDGYEVGVNERTGLPFLRRAGDQRDQCAALTQDGKQCLRAAREGSKYCHVHKGYQPPSRRTVEALSDTRPRAKGAADSRPGERGAQCAALTADGKQCTNRSRPGSKFCGVHKAGARRRSALDTRPSKGVRDTKPSVRKERAA